MYQCNRTLRQRTSDSLFDNSATPGHYLADRLREQAKKLSYHSHRKGLSKLEMRLDKANQSLNTALHFAGMHVFNFS